MLQFFRVFKSHKSKLRSFVSCLSFWKIQLEPLRVVYQKIRFWACRKEPHCSVIYAINIQLISCAHMATWYVWVPTYKRQLCSRPHFNLSAHESNSRSTMWLVQLHPSLYLMQCSNSSQVVHIVSKASSSRKQKGIDPVNHFHTFNLFSFSCSDYSGPNYVTLITDYVVSYTIITQAQPEITTHCSAGINPPPPRPRPHSKFPTNGR